MFDLQNISTMLEDQDVGVQFAELHLQCIVAHSFASMLHDREFNKKYNEALTLAINKMHSLGKQANVLDIGIGNGLLPMMAVNCGADSVVTCEAFYPLTYCAIKVLQVGNCQDQVRIIRKHCTQLTVGEGGDLPRKANILVTRVFDRQLIGDGALYLFPTAHETLLESDCIVIPSFAIMYAQVVESSTAQNWMKLQNFNGLEDNKLLIEVPNIVKSCTGLEDMHDIQLSQLSTDLFKQITAPQAIFLFDWSGKEPLILNETNALKLIAENSGVAQAIFMWWELGMNLDNTITLSCAPYWAHPLKTSKPNLTSSDIPWRYNWCQAIYCLPEEIRVQRGQEINLISCHDEFSVWFYVYNNLSLPKVFKKPICTCGFHIIHSCTRVGQMNDHSRRKKYISFLQKHVTNESVILFLGDSFYLGLVAARFGAKKLLFIEENLSFAMILKDFIQHNNLTNCEVLDSIDSLEVHPNSKDISLIFGEPYYNNSVLSWDNVWFAHVVKKAKRYINQEVVVAPKECVIKGLLVEFINLQRLRFPDQVCEEFDSTPFNNVIQDAYDICDPEIVAYPLWQFPCLAKSSSQIVCKLNMCDIDSSPMTSFKDFLPTEGNTRNFNAIAFWTEWYLDGTDENVITTGPIVPPTIDQYITWDMFTKQGVKFVRVESLDGTSFSFDFNVDVCQAYIIDY